MLVLGVWIAPAAAEPTPLIPGHPLPIYARSSQYTSSLVCRECHEEHYDSWHQTYHRTMTQAATPAAVLGRFDGTEVRSGQLKYRVWQEGGAYWAEMPDPDLMMYIVQGGKHLGDDRFLVRGRTVQREMHLKDLPRVRRQVLMTTGSHRYQTYWVGSRRHPGTLQTLPLVYLPAEDKWIPREEAFMRAPDDARMITQWNHHCINCHSTGPIPAPYEETATLAGNVRRVLETGFKTQAAELGIACEACHGPGETHARERTAESIVNPGSQDHERSSQICGQCHGVYIRRGESGIRFANEGMLYRPGEDLHAYRHYIQFPGDDATDEQRQDFQQNRDFFRQRWWDDGTVLAAGREYTALRVSACYQRGELSCLSCHSMHASDPNDQLKPRMRTSAACTKCHTEPKYTSEVTAHTFHASKSSGSNCLNCHMPHTTYALFTAIRNHQIRSPDLEGSIRHGVPHACNLCHLDKSLGWTQQHLVDWYGQKPLLLTDQQANLSAAMLWLLQGHAAQRAIVAWHAGWEPAHETSGTDWLAPLLAQLLDDPYGVVRYIAGSRLGRLPGFGDFQTDFLATPEEQTQAQERAVARWHALGDSRSAQRPREGLKSLFTAGGRLDEGRVRELVGQRDDRPVAIRE